MPLEWPGTHKQFLLTLISKDVLKADYWRAKHCCDAVSQLTCTVPLCCVADTYCYDRGMVAIFFGFISQEF